MYKKILVAEELSAAGAIISQRKSTSNSVTVLNLKDNEFLPK